MRLIDADELKEDLKQKVLDDCRYGEKIKAFVQGIINRSIDNQPTVEPVKRGEWVEDICCDGKIICNSCGNEAYYESNSSWYDDFEDEDGDDGSGYVYFDYCPHCGAKMDGEK